MPILINSKTKKVALRSGEQEQKKIYIYIYIIYKTLNTLEK